MILFAINPLRETTVSKKNNRKADEKQYQSTLHINIEQMRLFKEQIGFRYSYHKSQRLEAGCSYKRLRDTVTQQHNWIVNRVDELTNFKKIKAEFPKKRVSTKKAILHLVDELKKDKGLIHFYAIPTTHDITVHLIHGTKFGKFRSKNFPTPEEYFKEIGVLHWFVGEKKNENVHHGYGVSINKDVLEPMCLKIIHMKDIGEQPVCDIEVEETHSFVANGVVAHNCMISHGTGRFLREKLFDNSDKYQMIVCKLCGQISKSKNCCPVCNTKKVVKCDIPFTSKSVDS